jgi:hypothetical protein
MPERSINTIVAQVHVHGLHVELTIFGPFPHRPVNNLGQLYPVQDSTKPTHLYLQINKQPTPESESPSTLGSCSNINPLLIADIEQFREFLFQMSESDPGVTLEISSTIT